jgi:uncharacterized membrane protein (UPF0127 family)
VLQKVAAAAMLKTLFHMKSERMIPLLFALAALFLAGCNPTTSDPSVSREKVEQRLPAAAWFPIKIGSTELKVQLAVTIEEQKAGLMHRTTLASKEGMLFVSDTSGPRSFWMRNTSIPLDIGFITSKGILHEIYPMYPFDETSVKSRSKDIQYCLEVNQGWYAANNLKPGISLDLNLLRKALEARGFDPERYIKASDK